jgi:thioredoxin-dependent peroxiredoxin
VKPLGHLRTLRTTVAAIATGLVNVVLNRHAPASVELQPGDAAPDFTLAASDGRTYTLSQFTGRQGVVLAWFPKAFTGGCTTECESIGVSSHELRRFHIAHFGASVDTVETNRRFAASMGIDFPILSDPQKIAARAYGVLGSSGFPSRWTFFIGLDGRILAIDKHVRTSTHGADIAAALTELQIPRQV